MNYRKYITHAYITLLLLAVSSVASYAQPGGPGDGPGGGETPCGPEDVCPLPLDTWVWILMAIALIFVTLKLYRKQKEERPTIAG